MFILSHFCLKLHSRWFIHEYNDFVLLPILYNISWSFKIPYSYMIIMCENVLKVGNFLSRNEDVPWLSVVLNSSPLASISNIYIHISFLPEDRKERGSLKFLSFNFWGYCFLFVMPETKPRPWCMQINSSTSELFPLA